MEINLQVTVRDNNVDQALKALKKKMQREGIFREMKLRNHYEGLILLKEYFSLCSHFDKKLGLFGFAAGYF